MEDSKNGSSKNTSVRVFPEWGKSKDENTAWFGSTLWYYCLKNCYTMPVVAFIKLYEFLIEGRRAGAGWEQKKVIPVFRICWLKAKIWSLEWPHIPRGAIRAMKGKINNLIFCHGCVLHQCGGVQLKGFLGKAFGGELEFPWSWAPQVGALTLCFTWILLAGLFSLKPFAQSVVVWGNQSCSLRAWRWILVFPTDAKREGREIFKVFNFHLR